MKCSRRMVNVLVDSAKGKSNICCFPGHRPSYSSFLLDIYGTGRKRGRVARGFSVRNVLVRTVRDRSTKRSRLRGTHMRDYLGDPRRS